ncbi:MAG TPA: hypothetical protein DDX02_09565 [Clostridiaceae bacterium]|jgi:CRISPR-associated protein Csh1|nr:hypothetical protein [Clostridiaceae bacterium]HBG38818.1 hypothetical protein [Clostridiaceae bacterium]
MLKDITENYKKAIKQNKNIILDNYSIKSGLLLKFDINTKVSDLKDEDYLIVDKKNENINKIELLNWFKIRDFYSGVISTNKAIDLPAKKILSSNYLTVFIKKDVFPEVGKPEQMMNKEKLKERISGYYDALSKTEEKFISIFSESIFVDKSKNYEDYLKQYFTKEYNYIKDKERSEAIRKHKEYLINNLDEIIDIIKIINEKSKFENYIKIFFDEAEEIYEMENRVYTMPSLFNINKFNIIENGELFGLPSNDMNTNEKKPFLLSRTMKHNVPYRETLDDVQDTKNFYEWLKLQNRNQREGIRLNYDFDYDGTSSFKNTDSFYNIHMTNKENSIDEFDNIPFSISKINFNYRNYLKIYYKDEKGNSKIVLDESIYDLASLEKKVNQYYFSGRMSGYYKNNEDDIKIKPTEFTPMLKVLLLNSRDAFYDYFKNGVDISIKKMINKISMEVIEEQLRHTVKGKNSYKVQMAYNLRLSFLEFFNIEGGKEMADKISSIMENLKTKLDDTEKVVTCESDEEFYFTSGQLAYYILSKSQSQSNDFGIFEHFLQAKNSEQLKLKLGESLEIYRHAISMKNIKFKNAMAMVMGYETDEKISGKMKDMLLAGILANNVFYEKNKKMEAVNDEE